MTHHWDTRVLLLLAGFMQIHADPTISTSNRTPCYGDVVTLVCHHLEVASNPGRYVTAQPTWREDGVKITPSTGIYLHDDTSEDFTRTTLTINITVDHFSNKSFKYSCLLVLADEDGLPSGEVETSPEVTLNPVEPRPISDIHNINSRNTSIAFNWTHTPGECYKDRTSYYLSWVNIDNKTENGSDVTGEHMYNITGLVANGNYTVSVWAVVDRNVQSTAMSKNVTTGLPNEPHNIRFTLGSHSIDVDWEHDDSCYPDRKFNVSWQKSNDQFAISTTVTETNHNIPGLIPDTNYSICFSAISTSNEQVQSTKKCLYRKTRDGKNAAAIAGPVVGVVTITVVTVIPCML